MTGSSGLGMTTALELPAVRGQAPGRSSPPTLTTLTAAVASLISSYPCRRSAAIVSGTPSEPIGRPKVAQDIGNPPITASSYSSAGSQIVRGGARLPIAAHATVKCSSSSGSAMLANSGERMLLTACRSRRRQWPASL